MKVLNLVLAVFLLSGVAAAQAQSSLIDAPGVSVIKNSWSKQERARKLNTDDLLRDHENQLEYERNLKETLRANTIRAKANETPLRLPTPPRSSDSASARGHDSVEYVYKAEVSNTGTKAIRELVWGYVLVDPDTGREVGHQRFTSKVSIRSGKSKSLVGISLFSPASVVDVTKAGEERPGQYSERVVIHRIEYADGSSWQRPSN